MRWPVLLTCLAALCIGATTVQVRAQSTLGAPTISLTATTNTLTVSWSAPSETGGATITAYDLRYILNSARDKADANWTLEEDVWTTTGGGSFTSELQNLPDGVGYDVRVRAVATSDGPWSAISTGATNDHGGTTATATALSLDSSLPGRLDPATDVDMFTITLAAAGDLWVYATGELNTVGELLDSTGVLLRKNEDGTLLDSPHGFGLRHELTAGTYYVRVGSFEDREAGSYTIHAQTVTEPGSTLETAATVTLDSDTPARISPRGGIDGNKDTFKLVLTTAVDVWFGTVGTNETDRGDLDTFGEFLDDEGESIDIDDDGYLDRSPDGFLMRHQVEPGTYYIRVTGSERGEIGPYTLYVRTATQPGRTTSTATPITLGVPETGEIFPSSDRDYFTFTLAAETYVSIYAVTTWRAFPLTATVLNDQGSAVPMETIPHAKWLAQLLGSFNFRAFGRLQAGTYHIRVAPVRALRGQYVLHARVSPFQAMLDRCTGLTTPQSDPWYGCQWHLNNTGQFEGGAMQDINVESVWAGGNRGEGINVVVVDDRIQSNHEDLAANVLTARNHDYGSPFDVIEDHGTAVAGLIAARDNTVGVRGVAPRAQVFNYNLLSSRVSTTSNEAHAMYRSEDADHTAVSNNSWGFPDDGRPRMPAATWEAAIERGLTEGYNDKGILYVWAGGNGHHRYDYSAFDGRATFYGVVAVCAVNHGDVRTFYSEMGPNLWVCAPSGNGNDFSPEITTTAHLNRYRDTFTGTSAATPIVSGVAALVRAANTSLTWRDVKLILAASARKNDATNGGWQTGALRYGSTSERYEFNHEYGFGVVDAAAAVSLADGWERIPRLRSTSAQSSSLDLTLPDFDALTGIVTVVNRILTLDSHVEFVEFVEIEIDIDHFYYRDLQIELESPSGAVSVLSPSAGLGLHPLEYILGFGSSRGAHRFGSARHLGEDPSGTWTLRISDRARGDEGTLNSWKLKVYGHGSKPGYVDIETALPGPGSLDLLWKHPNDIGGSAITSYDLRYILEDADDLSPGNWTEVTNVGSTSSLRYALSGLEGERKFLVAMRAVNDSGAGAWSASTSHETEQSLPDAPSGVTVATRDLGLAVSWREPGYIGVGPVTSYDVRYIREDAADKADDFWTPLTNAWATGDGDLRYVNRILENDVEYEVQVRAENEAGAGEWSPTVKGTPADINSAAEFPGTETGRRSVDENTAAGVNIGDPVAARDDEGDTLTYSLGSGDDLFDIVATSGQLQTKAALNHEPAPSHVVTVRVHDGKDRAGEASTTTDDSIRVNVTVDDVDEPPVVEGPTSVVDFPENSPTTRVVGRYSATDPERSPGLTWSALSGNDAGEFQLDSAGKLRFRTSPNFEQQSQYEVTVNASDGMLPGSLDVTVTLKDVNERPTISGPVKVNFTENGTDSVATYSAEDPDAGTTFTWSLAGVDRGDFEITDGVLTFANPPDYDTPVDSGRNHVYDVTVRVYDGLNTVTRPVTVRVQDVNEAPTVDGDLTPRVAENSTGTVATYRATDPERLAISWSVDDASADDFMITSAGVLSFAIGRSPNYEAQTEHTVTVTASDGTVENDVDVDVTVAVTDVDENEELTLALRPLIGVDYMAAFQAGTGDAVQSATWAWERSTNRDGGWAAISGETADSYRPVVADRNYYLRVTASYNDGHGAKTLPATSELQTLPDRDTNTAPAFASPLFEGGATGLSVDENAGADTFVGTAPEATDAHLDPVTYSLAVAGFTSDPPFEIDGTTRRITVTTGALLNHEMQNTYSVTVTVQDDFNASATATFDITIGDVNEAPTAVPDRQNTNEGNAVTFDILGNDTDPDDGDTLTATIARRPAANLGSVSLDPNTQMVTYTPPDADFNGTVPFTYTVSDGGLNATGQVRVTVDPVNDPPTFPAATAARSVSEQALAGDPVGAPVAATDVDGDPLTYTLSGASGAFVIDEFTGQITVTGNVTLDTASPYTVTVTADDDDGQGLTDMVEVTITVTARPVRPPIITGGGGGGGGGPSPSTVDFEWTVKRDIEALDGGNDWPTGLWSDGTVLWVAENGQGADDAVYAYDGATGERLKEREFTLAETNRAPRGFWSDGDTVWVSDSGRDRLYAYGLASGERQEERELELADRNADARGVWSDGETVWVLDSGKNALFAYDLVSGELLAEYSLDRSNGDPRGIWADGLTVWVSDHGAKRLFAYRLPDAPAPEDAEAPALARIREEEFSKLSRASNNSPRGIWANDDVMYVADESDDRVYTYNMPDAIDARLASLTLSGVDIGQFSPNHEEYEGAAGAGVTETTVEAEAMQHRTKVVIEPPDADGNPDNGHQVDLEGLAAITVSVTSADGSRTRVYRVQLEAPASVLELSPTWTSIVWPGGEGVAIADALRGDGAEADITDRVIVIYRWDEATSTWLAYFPALADVPGINTLSAFAAGHTYWIAVTEPLTWTVPAAPAPAR